MLKLDICICRSGRAKCKETGMHQQQQAGRKHECQFCLTNQFVPEISSTDYSHPCSTYASNKIQMLTRREREREIEKSIHISEYTNE